jgi:hypothetical protein
VTTNLNINRRGWLALWLQKRRRSRVRGALPTLLPAPVLRAVYPDLLQWDWDLSNPYKWNVWMSLNGGTSWMLIEDYWMYGDARQFAPDGGSELYYIVGIDASGNEITKHSNAVRPDDAVPPPAAPTLVYVDDSYRGTAPVPASVWHFTQSDSPYDTGPVQDWVYGADLPEASYDLLPPAQAESEHIFNCCACRYQVDGVWSPWCPVINAY